MKISSHRFETAAARIARNEIERNKRTARRAAADELNSFNRT